MLKDNIYNFKTYRKIRMKVRRNWYDDVADLEGNDIHFNVDRVFKTNTIKINGKTVAELSFSETALLYRFLKKCVYR